MLGVFVDPYPDEIDYSVLARSLDRANLLNRADGFEILLGQVYRRPVVGFQGPLAVIARSWLPGTRLTIAGWLACHTLLPLYRSFLPVDRAQRLTHAIQYGGSTGLSSLIGHTNATALLKHRLWYCPACAAEDRDQHGEAYWHRIHQAQGVLVCDRHGCWLCASEVDPQSARDFIPAEAAISPTEPQPVDDPLLLALARDVRWLLNTDLPADPGLLRQRYLKALYAQQLATYSGNVRTAALTARIQQTVSDEQLAQLGADLNGRHPRHWAARIVQKACVQPPIRHLLLMHLLGWRAPDFFDMDPEIKPFGDGPWPCLSPTCAYRHERVIAEVGIGVSRKANRQPIGTFDCPHCGYTYRRVGPDTKPDDALRGKVLHYGSEWDARLRTLHGRGELTQKALAAAMGVGVDTLKRQLVRLEREAAPLKLDECKAQWCAIVRERGHMGTAALMAAHSELYQTLHRFDAAWLAAHTPDARHADDAPHREWAAEDIALAAQVADVAACIREQRPPRRVTRNAVGMALGFTDGSIHRHLPKLPRTAAAMAPHLETHEDFALRRVDLALARCRRLGMQPTEAQVIKLAGLSRAVQSERVLAAVRAGAQVLSVMSRIDNSHL